LALPDFNSAGDLPVGVHPAQLEEVKLRFGTGSLQRNLIMLRLERIYELALGTGLLRRFFVFGSFVTTKPEPNDVDAFILFGDNLEVDRADGELRILLDHHAANEYFGGSIFWMTPRAAFGGVQAAIEQWQVKRDGNRRGIVEIVR
jgi:hypothetical protein